MNSISVEDDTVENPSGAADSTFINMADERKELWFIHGCLAPLGLNDDSSYKPSSPLIVIVNNGVWIALREQ